MQWIIAPLLLCLGAALASPVAPRGCSAPKRPIAPKTEFENMRRAAQLASAAYLDCRPVAFDAKIDHLINENSTDTNGFIGHDDTLKRIIVSMRGTTNVPDTLNDLDITPASNPRLSGVAFPQGVQIHQGVLDAWSSVHDEVMQHVSRLHTRYPDYTLEAVGHSLGGSLTYLSHVALAQNFPRVNVTSYALAAFPIGNDVFARWAASQGTLRRVNNQGDGVPNMWNTQYEHYGTEYYGPGSPNQTHVCRGNKDMRCVAGDGWAFLDFAHVRNSGVTMILAGCGREHE